MRAAVLHAHGGPSQLVTTTVEDPAPIPGETLVRVLACGIEAGLDVRTRENIVGWDIVLPHVLGVNIAGEVVTSPDADAPPPGTRVAVFPVVTCGRCLPCMSGEHNACDSWKFIGVHRWGGYGELVAVPTRNLVTLSGDVRPELIAAAPMTYLTAWHLVARRGRVGPSDVVLILGASGAVGLAAAQIGRLHGAEVILGTRSPERLTGLARTLGAVGVVDASGDFAAEIRSLIGRPADVVLDTVGKSTWSTSIDALATNGRLLCCGGSSGGEVSMLLRKLYRKNLTLIFSAGGTYADFREVMRLVETGRLRPHVHATFSLEDVVEAHELLDSGDYVGKLVLVHGGGG